MTAQAQTTQQIDRDRFFSMAECYDRMAGYLVPRYDWLQNELIALLFADGEEKKFIVDIGAGSGILLEKVLTRHPSATACWVDVSDDFQDVARRRLARFGRRVRYVLSPLEAAWEEQLPQAPDAIVSMSAIHHLDSAGKRSLYARCYEALVPGGWLYNVDETATLYADAYMNTLRYWVRHVNWAAQRVPAELVEDCRRWCDMFEHWQERNIARANTPKQAGDDVHESFLEQMKWLREIGFTQVDLFLKFQLWSAFGGRRE